MGVDDVVEQDLLERAQESCDAAEFLLQGGYPGFAASRAYYAMFYVAEALLDARGLSFSRHSAVIAAFGRELCKTGVLPVEMHRHLLQAFEIRNLGDYATKGRVTAVEARTQITRAREMLEAARGFRRGS